MLDDKGRLRIPWIVLAVYLVELFLSRWIQVNGWWAIVILAIPWMFAFQVFAYRAMQDFLDMSDDDDSF